MTTAKIQRSFLTALLLTPLAGLHAAEARDTFADAWPATDALGRPLPLYQEAGDRRANKFVGIFYFNWQASFTGPPFNHSRVFDNTKLIAANPNKPAWGPPGIPHYWGEPRFGYYRPDDPWVIRKHVQLLADAGVDVRPVYLDDQYDTTHRDHDGVAGAGRYTNRSGRNDLDTMHVTHDATHLFFHVRTREPLTPATDADWMVLLLDTDQDPKTGRLGYDFRLNQTRNAPDTVSIERWSGKTWETLGTAKLQTGTNELHLAVERSALAMAPDKPLGFDFKWTDNVPASADGIDFLDQGDTAPNARFNYRFITP